VDLLTTQFSEIMLAPSEFPATEVDTLAEDVMRMTLQGLSCTQVPDERDPRFPTPLNRTSTSKFTSVKSAYPRPDAVAALDAGNGNSQENERLWLLDQELDLHSRDVLLALDELASTDDFVEVTVLQELKDELDWLKRTRGWVDHFRVSQESAGILKVAMLDRLADFIDATECYIAVLQARALNGSPLQTNSQKTCSTGMTSQFSLISKRADDNFR
jgi:hypothetical protein